MMKRTTFILLLILFFVSAIGLIYKVFDERNEEQASISDVITVDKTAGLSNGTSLWHGNRTDIDEKDTDLPLTPSYDKDINQGNGLTSKKKLADIHLQTGYSNLKKGEYHDAIRDFEEAIRLDEENSDSYIGLGFAYYRLNDMDRALESLEKGLGISSNAPAYKLLGEIYYQKDEIDRALTYWRKALSLEPGDDGLRRKFLKASRELETHKGFNREITHHFIVQYEGGERSDIERKIVDILEDAYRQIGGELSYYPRKKLTVILYSNQQFRYVTEGPSWSSGIYDGKIRVPIGGLTGNEPMLRQILFHEYTHSLVHSITDRCPTWLNEGLAQYFEGRDRDRAERIVKESSKRKSIVSLQLLEGSFLRLNKNQADLAYAQSLSAVSYMIERYGLYKIKDILLELSKGKSIDESFKSSIHISYREFEADWLRYIVYDL